MTNPILTARAAITKVEVLGFTPYYFVMNPLDWERIETAQLDAGQYVLNAEGSRNGVPVDMAARRLWGVPVTVTTGVASGTGYLLSSGVAQIVTDGQIATEWSNATADDFTRNQVRLRVEGRFDLSVTRPLGVVRWPWPNPTIDLGAACLLLGTGRLRRGHRRPALALSAVPSRADGLMGSEEPCAGSLSGAGSAPIQVGLDLVSSRRHVAADLAFQ